MEKKSKYFTLYRFVTGTNYKAKAGKDGITENDMRNLRRVDKSEQKTKDKVERLETVLLEATFIDSEKNLDLVDPDSDVEILIEIAEEYTTLHKALAQLSSQQKDLIYKKYFEEKSTREIAAVVCISQPAVVKQIIKAKANLKKILKNL